MAIRYGVDVDGNGTLDPSEVTATDYVCNRTASPDATPVLLPPVVYFVEGMTGAVYFENVTLADSMSLFTWDVSGSLGQQFADRWAWTPDVPRAPVALTITSHERQSGSPLASASMIVHAAASDAGAGRTVSCLFIGDSLTNGGVYTQALLDLASADSMMVTLLGTRGVGLNRHEGRPGWRIAFYTSDYANASGPNPFWFNGRIDFPAYLGENGLPVPDWVFVLLGTNDVFGAISDEAATSTARTAFDALDLLVASIRSTNPAPKIGLITPPPPTTSQDLFAANYGVGQTRWRFKRNILLWNAALVARYREAQADGVHIVPAHVAIDTANAMLNGVHPAPEGHRQIAQQIWAFLKANAPTSP